MPVLPRSGDQSRSNCTALCSTVKKLDSICSAECSTIIPMKPKSEVLQIRISALEKDGFELAALLAGISVSSWVRERLRLAAIRELESAGRRVPFVPEIPLGGDK